MADQGRWFKLWVSALADPSLDNLSIAQFGRWCKLGTYTKAHGQDGTVTLVSPAKILVSMLQCDDFQHMIACIEEMPNLTVSLGTNTVVSFRNWAKYQGDFSTARVRKFRQMKRSKRRGEEKRGEEKRGEGKDVGAEPGKPAAPIPPTLAAWLAETRHLQPLGNGRCAGLWQTLERAYDQYPWLFFEDEIRKADAWLEANPSRRPTPKGLGRFMRSWLERAVEMGRRHHAKGA